MFCCFGNIVTYYSYPANNIRLTYFLKTNLQLKNRMKNTGIKLSFDFNFNFNI